VTGTAITGLTSPTYTFVTDTAPAVTAKQWACTALGGTQTGASAHTVSSPFTFTFFRAPTLRTIPSVNANGVIKNIPVNTYKALLRKGAVPALNQAPVVNSVEIKFNVHAGSDSQSPVEISAMMSCLVGLLTQNAQGISDTLKTGTI
jgi:hypothetical protein